MPRSGDRGTFAGQATIAGKNPWLAPPSGSRGGGRVEHQSDAVHAVTKTRRLRPIVEDVTEMAATAAAMNLGAQHAEDAVLRLADGVVKRLEEARPAGAAYDFRI